MPKLVQKPQRFDGQAAGQYKFKYDSPPKAGSTAIIGLASSAVPSSVVVGTQSLPVQSSIGGTVFVEIRSVEISAQNTGQVVVTFTTPATVALVLTEWSGLGPPSFIDPIAAKLSFGSSLASTNSGAGKPGQLLFAMMGAVSVEPTSVSAPFTSLERGRAGVVGFGGASLVLTDETARKAEWPLDNSGNWGALLVKFPAK